MPVFSNAHIAFASPDDINVIKQLLNSAYRGDTSKQGWTTEAHLIAGEQRTNEDDLQNIMKENGSVFLTYTDDRNEITGCVNLKRQGTRLYLGMFSVAPRLQGGGIGKQLLQASEEYAKSVNCTAIYMTVISVRTELIDWYKRHGYEDTGERKFFKEDGIHGKHLQSLIFMTLQKEMGSI